MFNPEIFTLGVEEEFQIVDPQSRELKSHIQQILDEGKIILAEKVKPEMHQSVVELGTDVCKNVDDARSQVTKLRTDLAKLAIRQNLRIAAAGTHPFSHWKDQKITSHPRYKNIIDDFQQVARANLIFGLHVHVGVDSRETAIHIMNAARYFLPHIFALSTNSPFWLGRNTGFKSYRSKVFDRFPRTGIPDFFMSLSEYDNYVNLLIKTNCIDDAKKIWWDIRVHPYFQTLEYRVCDIPMRVDETICLTALIQSITAKLYKLIKQNLGFRLYRRAKLADELLEFIDDVVDDLKCREEAHYLKKIIETGTGADRQLEVFQQSSDLKNVVDYIIHETHVGLNLK